MNDPQPDIEVTVRTTWLEDQSSAEENRYAFAYTITIRNRGDAPARLLSRHWIITDANNAIQEVRGMGVVGEQPRIEPGGQFEYTSGATLATPVGTMRGSYEMQGDDGARFEAPIGEFLLSVPRALH